MDEHDVIVGDLDVEDKEHNEQNDTDEAEVEQTKNAVAGDEENNQENEEDNQEDEEEEEDVGRLRSTITIPTPASPRNATQLLDAPSDAEEDEKPSTSRRVVKRPRAADLNDADGDWPTRRRASRHDSPPHDGWEEKTAESNPVVKKEELTDTLLRSGGAYIPPAKLRLMQAQIADKSSEAYQRMNWERLKKKIHGQVNRVNTSNIVEIVRALLQENVQRGKGLLVRALIQAQAFSPSFSHVFAALTAIINSKFPNIGELLLRRLIIQFKRSFRRNDKTTCVNVCRFLAHLVNQRVAHEIVVLEILVLLMHTPTDDSIEVAVTLLKECGAMLQAVTPKGLNAIFDRLRAVLNEADTIEHRTQYMIETMFHIRKSKFEGYPTVIDALDLIDEEDQITHLFELTAEDGKPYDAELKLNIFQLDPEFEKNEAEYEEIHKEIVGDVDDDEEDEAADGEEEAEDDEMGERPPPTMADGTKIVDMTGQDLVAFRRNVYLTIQSSLDFQEAAHKLLKKELRPGTETELCHMIVDCCAQLRTYERFYGLLSERFCKLRREFQTAFERIARDTYHAIARFDITKLRNMAKLVAHLLATDAIDWGVLGEIRLNENDTTSASRIYIKYLFEELVQTMSEVKVYERTCDPTLQHAFEGILPRDNPKDTIFAINFFTLSGLGNLTMDLREHLQKVQKKKVKKEKIEAVASSSSSSSSSSSDSSDSASTVSSTRQKKTKKSKKSSSKHTAALSNGKEESIVARRERQLPRAADVAALQIKDELVDPDYDGDGAPARHSDRTSPRRRSPKRRNLSRSPRRRDTTPSRYRRDQSPIRQTGSPRRSPKRELEDSRRQNRSSPSRHHEERRRRDYSLPRGGRNSQERSRDYRRGRDGSGRRRDESQRRRERADHPRRRSRSGSRH